MGGAWVHFSGAGAPVGGRPISGTVECHRCHGSKKCQRFGTGTAMTCGCTVFGNLFEAAEAVKTVESEEAAEAVTTVESEEGDSEFGGASRCASEFSDGFCVRGATTD